MSTIDTDTQDKSYSKPQRRLQVMCKEFLLFLFLWLAPFARSQNTKRDRPLKASFSSINMIRAEREREREWHGSNTLYLFGNSSDASWLSFNDSLCMCMCASSLHWAYGELERNVYF